MKRDWPYWSDFFALASLALLTIALHHSALSGSWRWDDGLHLLHTTQYSWTALFLDPEVLLSVSGNQFAPWNLFLYYVNGALFGADARLYYAHHLISLWAAAAALYALLRQWLPASRAWLAPGLLLIGAPTFQMAQQLMVGHYLDGLVFASLGLLMQVRGVKAYGASRGKTLILSCAGALLYGLACLCKEIYVPWVLMWLVVSWVLMRSARNVAVCTAPVLLVALAYTIARLLLFGDAGGYYGGGSGSWEPARLFQSMAAIPGALLGEGMRSIAPLFVVVLAFFAGTLASGTHVRLMVCAAALIATLTPLVFLASSNPPWELHARYVWAPWLLMCLIWAMPWSKSLQRLQWIACLFFVIFVVWQATILREGDQQREAMFDAHSRMLLQPPEGVRYWVPAEFNSPVYLTFATYAAREALHRKGHVEGEPLEVLRTIPSTPEEHAVAQAWDRECHCFKPLLTLAPAERDAALNRLHAERGMLMPGAHPMADVYTGPTPEMVLDGNRLQVSGSIMSEGPGNVLMLANWFPSRLIASSIIREAELDNSNSQTVRFKILFESTDPASASELKKNLCVLTQSQSHPYTYILLDAAAPSTACRILLTPLALRRPAAVQH
ncbi:hypothetical protein [Acidovorax sp. A1169]|uniref:hypothetical protein n=1 Tax=Acidovorax sp. A1169 TaxID=3059524 RepID=UPI00273802D8|nr:hypothetical protein [Acidovorax sp. A1169]MDP4075708.1 hypothetical protein [Acidovorax sp. A1169]